VPHGLADMHSVLLAARGIAAVTAGRFDDAFAILRRAFDPRDPAHHYCEQFGALGYFAEAAVGSGQTDQAHEVIDALDALVGPSAAPALRAAVAFANALLAHGDQPPAGTSLRLDEDAHTRPFNRARLHSRTPGGSPAKETSRKPAISFIARATISRSAGLALARSGRP
jgi:hypothetical protein